MSGMNELEHQARKRNEEWERLEETIIALVKEHYRLMGIVCYETLGDHTIAENMRDYWKHLGNDN